MVWGWLFVLSTCSYLVDYFGLHGYLRWSLILLFMVLKAGLIVAVFMHMAWERLALGLCHPAAAGAGAGVRGDHGVRIRLHAPHPGPVLRVTDVDAAATIFLVGDGDSRMRSFLLVLGAGIFTIVPGYAQDAASGEKIFVQCKACHQIGENAKNAIGPVLNGLFGRKAGTIEGYSYSTREQEFRNHLG